MSRIVHTSGGFVDLDCSKRCFGIIVRQLARYGCKANNKLNRLRPLLLERDPALAKHVQAVQVAVWGMIGYIFDLGLEWGPMPLGTK